MGGRFIGGTQVNPPPKPSTWNTLRGTSMAGGKCPTAGHVAVLREDHVSRVTPLVSTPLFVSTQRRGKNEEIWGRAESARLTEWPRAAGRAFLVSPNRPLTPRGCRSRRFQVEAQVPSGVE